MEIEDCRYCGRELPERAFYCPNCAKQVRCKNCRDILEPDARACVTCGTTVGEGDKAQVNDSAKASNLAVNTIEFRETQKSRSLRANFTDTIGNGLNETLNSLITNRMGPGRGLGQKSPVYGATTEQQKQLPAFAELSDTPNEIIDVSAQNEDLIHTENRTNAENLAKLFRFNDDNSLTLIDSRLKASSKADFARRLTYLFLYAHELASRKQVPRTDLNAVLKQIGVYDKNTAKWVSKSPDLLVAGGLVELRVPGREHAIEILNDTSNPMMQDTWKPGTAPRRRSSKHGTASEDKTEQEGKGSKGSSITPNSGSSSRTGRATPTAMLTQLISGGFFSERRTIGGIVSYCESTLATRYKPSELSSILTRFTRDKKLSREKNSNDQYEYFT